MRGTNYIAKTPRLLVINIRGSKETVCTLPTVSVKKRGTDWRDSETFTTTEHCCEGRGATLQEAQRIMWEKWDRFARETFGESIFVEQATKTWEVMNQ